MSAKQHFAELIELGLTEFLAESQPDNLELRELAANLHVLPVYSSWFRCLAIRPDGEVISFDIATRSGVKPPGDIRIEEHAVTRNLAFDKGSKKFHALRPLAPQRPSEAADCSNCDGHGEFPVKHLMMLCSHCGGLGWVPPNSTKGDNDWVV